MNGAAWLLALATLGVDYGWRLDEKGQLEYIIQISPDHLDSLRESPEGITSAIPPEVARHVKRFRIVVGNEALPRDPLPEFQVEEGRVSPINVGAARVATAGADLPVNDDSNFAPELESTVTPLETLNAPRNALPGPGHDLEGDPRDNVNDILPLPPIPRANSLLAQSSPLATATLGPTLQRETDGSFEANVSPNTHAPDTSDVWGDRSRSASRQTSPTSTRLPPRSELTETWNGNTPSQPAKNPFGLFFAVCGLCLSLGGNVYLGWIAWGYYLKYRESFEAFRSHA